MKQTIGKMMGAKAWTLLLLALFALLPKAAMAQKFALIDTSSRTCPPMSAPTSSSTR